MNEGNPMTNGSMKIWNQINQSTGAQAISLRVLEFGQGVSPLFQNRATDEVFYFLEQIEGRPPQGKRCKVHLEGQSFDVEAQTGIYLKPEQTMLVENPGITPITVISAQCPELSTQGQVAPTHARQNGAIKFPGVRLSDRQEIPTADRWYRVLVDDEVGSEQVTQFVGSIPPGRAPDHFHEYEEVLFILRGQGRMWAGRTTTAIGPGSCIYLPKRQVHCVENTGTEELRLLGVFYPAGSPSVRYEA
jgi:mannose-6-phosphate isomerase-like protein (cupin superfamily)